MLNGPVYETIEIKDTKVPVRISSQKRTKGFMGAPLHWHEAIEFYFVLSGGVEVLCNGKKEWLYEGDTAYISWCEIHKGTEFLDNTLFLSVQIDLSSLENLSNGDNEDRLFGIYKTLPTYIRGDAELIKLALELQKAYQRNDMSGMYMVRSVIYHILAHLLSLEPEDDSSSMKKYPLSLGLVRKALFYIAGHSKESISLQTLSTYLGVTNPHQSRIFKHHTNQTVHQYINEYRCHNALSLIQDGESFAQAAYLVGYEDYNYFSRTFKKVFGQSPRYYLGQ